MQKNIFIASLITGAIAGACSGYFVSIYMQDKTPRAIVVNTPVKPVTTSTLSVISFEKRSATSLAPPVFIHRRVSSIGQLYKKSKSDDHVLRPEALLGSAVALTSDGWFITSPNVIDISKISDSVLWFDSVSYTLERAIFDSVSGAVFFKTSVSRATPPAFARTSDIGIAAEVWIESRSGEFVPSIVMSTRDRVNVNEAVSSEVASRRLRIAGMYLRGDLGSAIWDPNGSLVGIVDGSSEERMRIIPASTISTSFSNLLDTGKITHAFLGIRAIDLASQKVDAPHVSGQPLIGAYIKNVIPKISPAFGKLKTGDVILRVERDILDGSADLGEILSDYHSGTQITLRVWREGQDLDIPIVLK